MKQRFEILGIVLVAIVLGVTGGLLVGPVLRAIVGPPAPAPTCREGFVLMHGVCVTGYRPESQP